MRGYNGKITSTWFYDGEWGSILNEFLLKAHTNGGDIKPGSIDESILSAAVQSKLNTGGGQTGATGPQGVAGPAGAVGATGTNGSAGPAGATGAMGPSGMQGATGPAGATTINGVSGLQAALDAKAETSSLATVATSGSYNDLSNKPVIAAPGVVSVLVATGSEARPTATTVLWLGGTTQPTNMDMNDLWFSQDPAADTTAPQAPTNLVPSNITSTSFTLTWTAATDNVGVTAYEVFIDNISYAIVAGTSINVTGRAGNTDYVCKVRARDAAGNWGTYTSDVTVTTNVSSSTTHTVYANSPQPGLLVNNDGGTIIVASGFYVVASGWSVKGARVYVPTGQVTPATCTVHLYTPAGTNMPNLSSPVQSTTLPITAGQWSEVDFASTTSVANGVPFWIGYDFGDGTYLSTTSVGSSAVQANDGSELYLGADTMSAGAQRRQAYRINNGATSWSSINGQGYGIDVIVSET